MKKNQPKKKSKYRVINIIFWVVLGIVAVYAVVALTSNGDGVHSIFGKTAFTVQTNSMVPEFKRGDLIYDETNFNVDDIEIGDVITYQAMIDVNNDGQPEWVYNSHRVVGIDTDVNNYIHFITKGDNNGSVDPGDVHQNQVVGLWTGKVTKNIGGIIDGLVGFLKSGTGFLIFIVIPCFAFLAYEVVRFVGVMSEYKMQQALADRVKVSEEALAAARAQLEAEAKLGKETQEKNSKEDKE